MADILIRDAVPEDSAPLSYLLGELGYPTTPEKAASRLAVLAKETNYKTLTAEIDGKAVGFIGLCVMRAYESDGFYIRVLALAVHPNHRGTGVGTALIRAAENWARSLHACGIALDSGVHRKNAHAFYIHRGFSIRDYGFGKSL